MFSSKSSIAKVLTIIQLLLPLIGIAYLIAVKWYVFRPFSNTKVFKGVVNEIVLSSTEKDVLFRTNDPEYDIVLHTSKEMGKRLLNQVKVTDSLSAECMEPSRGTAYALALEIDDIHIDKQSTVQILKSHRSAYLFIILMAFLFEIAQIWYLFRRKKQLLFTTENRNSCGV